MFHRMTRGEQDCPDLAVPTRATLMAMALAELVLRGSTVDVESSNGPATDVTLVIEATKPTYPNHSADDERVSDDPPGEYEGDVHAALIDRCGAATTPDVVHVHDDVAAILLCDPVITALVIDMLGVPLDLGRKIRLVNRDQRRALGRRDGGCVFPGCDMPTNWCDAHHVTWWNHGGPTDCWNLALLCRYHHGVVHRRGWSMAGVAGQWFTITTPSGQVLHSQRHRGRSPTGHVRPA
jgi:hypothetical protein